MIIFLLSFILTLSVSFAEVGKVISLYGSGTTTLIRNGNETNLTPETLFEKDDEIRTTNSTAILHIYPSSQIAVGQNSQIKITESIITEDENNTEVSESIINLIKGFLRLQITKEADQKIDQKVVAKDVTFGVRGTDFEVNIDDEGADLDVYEGEVEVSSPEVQTFVPEIVKRDQGFRFSRKEKKFQRRKFASRLKDARFMNRQELRKKWRAKRSARKDSRKQRAVRRKRRN